jgi:hypothetical protein
VLGFLEDVGVTGEIGVIGAGEGGGLDLLDALGGLANDGSDFRQGEGLAEGTAGVGTDEGAAMPGTGTRMMGLDVSGDLCGDAVCDFFFGEHG